MIGVEVVCGEFSYTTQIILVTGGANIIVEIQCQGELVR
jgi:hypothetical protein